MHRLWRAAAEFQAMRSIPGVTPISVGAHTTGTGGAGAGLVLSVPSHVDGQLLVAQVYFTGSALNGLPTPTGWTGLINATANGSGSGTWFYRFASSEPASYTFTTGTPANITSSAGIMAVLSSNITSIPTDRQGANTETVATVTHTTPSETPTFASDIVLVGFCAPSGITWSGLSAAFTQIGVATFSGGATVLMAYDLPNNTNPISATVTSSASVLGIDQIALLKHS